MTDFNTGLERRVVNHAPLTPLDFIARTADVYGDRLAVVHGEIRRNWRETYARSRQLASALQRRGIAKDDTVAVLLPNIPAMVKCHFGVPTAGAGLNTLNTRLDFASILYMLRHGEAKVLIADTEYLPLVEELRQALPELQIIGVHDQAADTPAVPVGWI